MRLVLVGVMVKEKRVFGRKRVLKSLQSNQTRRVPSQELQHQMCVGLRE